MTPTLIRWAKAGFFCLSAALRFSTDAKASLFEPRLAERQKNPGQTIEYDRTLL